MRYRARPAHDHPLALRRVRFGLHHPRLPERDLFIDNLLVRIHFIIEMIWWTSLAPWEHPRLPHAGNVNLRTTTSQKCGGGLVFKARRLVYHSTLGLRVIKKKKRGTSARTLTAGWEHDTEMQLGRRNLRLGRRNVTRRCDWAQCRRRDD